MNSMGRGDIEALFDRKVRPELAMHGGDIEIIDFTEGVLRVRLLGQCSQCPSAGLTMEHLVRSELAEAFPQLKEVILQTGVSEALLTEAQRIRKMRAAAQ